MGSHAGVCTHTCSHTRVLALTHTHAHVCIQAGDACPDKHRCIHMCVHLCRVCMHTHPCTHACIQVGGVLTQTHVCVQTCRGAHTHSHRGAHAHTGYTCKCTGTCTAMHIPAHPDMFRWGHEPTLTHTAACTHMHTHAHRQTAP